MSNRPDVSTVLAMVCQVREVGTVLAMVCQVREVGKVVAMVCQVRKVGSLGLELEESVTTNRSASARRQHVRCR